MDPRRAVIDERLAGIRRVVAVTGGKGGIGKSVIASTLSLALADAGHRVGLLDLDLTGPCAHLILGAPTGFPEEQHGVTPPTVHGVQFMSIACFARDEPTPLRGPELTDALVELLAITRWGDLDVLVVDMPPGLGDAALDVLQLMPRTEFLVVATASRVAIETVRRTLDLLAEQRRRVLGVVENMHRDGGSAVEPLARAAGVPFLGCVPFDPDLERALGDGRRLPATAAGLAIRAIGLGAVWPPGG
jgi:ATP-binding protein involved in chromosome partitioning